MESRVFTGVKGANRRSVWTIPTKPYKGAHFATFPRHWLSRVFLPDVLLVGLSLIRFSGLERSEPWRLSTEGILSALS